MYLWSLGGRPCPQSGARTVRGGRGPPESGRPPAAPGSGTAVTHCARSPGASAETHEHHNYDNVITGNIGHHTHTHSTTAATRCARSPGASAETHGHVLATQSSHLCKQHFTGNIDHFSQKNN